MPSNKPTLPSLDFSEEVSAKTPAPGMAEAPSCLATFPKQQASKQEKPNEQTKKSLKPRQGRRERPSLWYCIHLPQLALVSKDEKKQYLIELAELVYEVSSSISRQQLCLTFEIRSSLKYFGSIDALHEKLRASISQKLASWGLDADFRYAASPTISGSQLLARAGHNALVYRKINLRSVLGKLPVKYLDINTEQHRRLHNMGLYLLRDIWRLPSDGLRKRFGSEFVNHLNKALGLAAEPIDSYRPPPAFNVSYEFAYAVENTALLIPVAEELIMQLCDFLRQRDLSAGQLCFHLLYERQEATIIPIHLRQATRSRQQLLLLLETQFEQLQLTAAVAKVKLEVIRFDAFISQTESLLIQGKYTTTHYAEKGLDQFMEQLQARLGGRSQSYSHHSKKILAVKEHHPSYSSQLVNFDEPEQLPKQTSNLKSSAVLPVNQRPFWLLEKPCQLTARKGKLYHRSAITIQRGPERIENRWWADGDIKRDYYTAIDAQGIRLWIYRERTQQQQWFLHGIFS